MELTNKNVFVTGSSRGIGLAIAHKFASLGANVVLNGRGQLGQDLLDNFAGYGVKVLAISGDISSAQDAKRMVTEAIETLGRVDILVNNAGITKDGTLKKMTVEQWQDVINTNLNSVFNLSKAVLDDMVAAGHGRIINISSINGQKGQFGQTNYSAAKAGMHGFTMALAQEVAKKGVTVNTISPGYIATAMVMAVPEEIRNQIIAQIPVNRLGKPEEIGGLVTYLASDGAGFITGSNIAINGGQHMK